MMVWKSNLVPTISPPDTDLRKWGNVLLAFLLR
jgi:hypothetical protein